MRRAAFVAGATIGVIALSSCSTASTISREANSTTLESASNPPTTDTALPPGFGPGPAGHGMARFLHQSVTWNSCDNGFECATIWAPLDYAKPNGEAITIAMAKQPASDQAAKQGSLFINPGGPGQSGIEYLEEQPFDSQINAHYDLIGFDPRGIGRSTPIDCLTDAQLDQEIASDPDPQGDREIAEFTSEFANYVEGCRRRSGQLLPHVATVDVAHDLDLMRALLGDKVLNFYGGSYGTYMGATYAGLFPTHVGRMVLDGAVDPEQSLVKTSLLQARGFQKEFDAYAANCLEQQSCPVGSSVADVRRKVIEFLEELRVDPLPTSSGRRLTEGLAFYGIVYPLYAQAAWPALTVALSSAFGGDGSTLLQFADLYASRSPDGTYSTNSFEAQTPIQCLDTPVHESVSAIERRLPIFERASPLFGAAIDWGTYGCANWPYTADESTPDFSAKGAPPIVVIGTTGDPATPYSQAVHLADILDSGVLLTRVGEGHTAYNSGNPCITSAVDTFFVDGTIPKPGTRC